MQPCFEEQEVVNEVTPVGGEELVGWLGVLDADKAKGGPGLGQRADQSGTGRVWDAQSENMAGLCEPPGRGLT